LPGEISKVLDFEPEFGHPTGSEHARAIENALLSGSEASPAETQGLCLRAIQFQLAVNSQGPRPGDMLKKLLPEINLSRLGR
jgi:hypothetical protein